MEGVLCLTMDNRAHGSSINIHGLAYIETGSSAPFDVHVHVRTSERTAYNCGNAHMITRAECSRSISMRFCTETLCYVESVYSFLGTFQEEAEEKWAHAA